MGGSKNGTAASSQREPLSLHLASSAPRPGFWGKLGALSLSLEVGVGFEGVVVALPLHNNLLGCLNPTFSSKSVLPNVVTTPSLIYCKGGGSGWGALRPGEGAYAEDRLSLALRHLIDSRLLVTFYSRSNSLVTGDHTPAES